VEATRALQFIQKKMLSTLVATVVVAVDGSEVVAMFINALEIASGGVASEERVALPYDVIFMDCQVHFPFVDAKQVNSINLLFLMAVLTLLDLLCFSYAGDGRL
jgi:hypothetical protein